MRLHARESLSGGILLRIAIPEGFRYSGIEIPRDGRCHRQKYQMPNGSNGTTDQTAILQQLRDGAFPAGLPRESRGSDSPSDSEMLSWRRTRCIVSALHKSTRRAYTQRNTCPHSEYHYPAARRHSERRNEEKAQCQARLQIAVRVNDYGHWAVVNEFHLHISSKSTGWHRGAKSPH